MESEGKSAQLLTHPREVSSHTENRRLCMRKNMESGGKSAQLLTSDMLEQKNGASTYLL